MKILLIRPGPEKETIGLQHVMVCEPLELEYLSSALKHSGIAHVRIVDMILETQSLKEIVRSYGPDLVGITGYITHVGVVKTLAGQIKQWHPCKIAVGGVHAEVVPADFRSPNINYIVYANGIFVFTQLASALKKGEDPFRIRGIWHENAVPEKAQLQIDTLFPDRDAVKKYRTQYYYMFHNPCALVKTSIGCQFRCRFCFCHKITNGICKRRSPEHVVEELKRIPQKEIYMVDDNFLHGIKWLNQFMALLKSNGIEKNYLVYGRADFIAANPDLIARLRQTGLKAVIVGLESFQTKELVKYNKKSCKNTNEAAVRILKKNGIECYGTFITGLDWRVKDFFNLFLWIRRLGLMFVNLQPLTPYPGTDIYGQYEKQFCVQPKDYKKWDLAHLVIKPDYLTKRAYYGLLLVLYYFITMDPVAVIRMIRRYGLKPVLKLSAGSFKITRQYIEKVIWPDK